MAEEGQFSDALGQLGRYPVCDQTAHADIERRLLVVRQQALGCSQANNPVAMPLDQCGKAAGHRAVAQEPKRFLAQQRLDLGIERKLH
ncbi:hypothetical protein D3C87_1351910 [compost metagenome]